MWAFSFGLYMALYLEGFMRGGNSLKNYIIAGLIAGFVSGIVWFIFHISGLWDLFLVPPFFDPVDIQTLALIDIIQGSIWGIIFGAFYALFYDYIPAKGIKKGLYYGLIIWIIIFFRSTVIKTIHAYVFKQHIIPEAIASFFAICIAYGLLIGYLYKPKK
jgi:hypothetical protein